MGRPFSASMPKHGGDAGKQNRHLEGDHDERRPGMIRLAADVERIVDRRHPVLHQVAGEAADDAADQHHQRNFVVVKADVLGQAFDRERAVGVDLVVAGLDASCAPPRPERWPNRTPP